MQRTLLRRGAIALACGGETSAAHLKKFPQNILIRLAIPLERPLKMTPIVSFQKEQKMEDGQSTLIVPLPLMVFPLLPFFSIKRLHPHQKQHLPPRPRPKPNRHPCSVVFSGISCGVGKLKGSCALLHKSLKIQDIDFKIQKTLEVALTKAWTMYAMKPARPLGTQVSMRKMAGIFLSKFMETFNYANT